MWLRVIVAPVRRWWQSGCAGPQPGQSGGALGPLIGAVEFGDDRVECVDQPEPLGAGEDAFGVVSMVTKLDLPGVLACCVEAVRGKYVSPEGEVHAHCRFRLEANDFRRAVREDGQGVDRVVESAVVDRVGTLRCAHRALFLLRERKLPLFPVSSRSNPQDENLLEPEGTGPGAVQTDL
ncbi:hypothetical protein GS495_18730 [Rhodococcus hoagii]|nr:hypothetical protein [Prescottella equi]NKT14986.1 hypothetical protein [Prescottella equi]